MTKTSLYRRFKRLSARNLLYLESSLSSLEEEQDRLDEEIRHSEDMQLSAQSWDLLCLQASTGNEMAGQRYALAIRIRDVLRTYRA